MSKELVERLRWRSLPAQRPYQPFAMLYEAADRIEQLQQENEKLKESVDWWMKDSAAAWDKCEERRLELAAAREREAKLRDALKSIAINSCCETCIEASLVAAKAIAQTEVKE